MRGDLKKPIRNQISTKQAARLMYEIVTNQAISPKYSQEMLTWLVRDLKSKEWQKIDPKEAFNPVINFFGESLPPNVYLVSKAGLTSNTRQEVAFVRTSDGKTAYILAIFAEDSSYVQNEKIFPKMSRLVFDRLTNNN
jgi:beta-lactamase class A